MTPEGKTTKRRRQREAGFSLLEFLVSTSITVAVIGMGLTLLNQGQSMFSTQVATLKTQSQARKTVNLITSDLRSTGCAPVTITAGTTPGLISATTTSLRIVGDRKGNGTTNVVGDDDANDDVTYSKVNSFITRYAPNDPAYQGAATTLTDQVRSLSFRYYDKDGNELVPPTGASLDATNCNKVVRILVTVTVEILENGKTTKTLTLESPVTLRNRVMDGY